MVLIVVGKREGKEAHDDEQKIVKYVLWKGGVCHHGSFFLSLGHTSQIKL